MSEFRSRSQAAARMLLGMAAVLIVPIARAQARDLSLLLPTPALIAPWHDVFIRTFSAATGIPATATARSGTVASLEAQAKAPNQPWDLMMVDSEELAAGCSGGLFEKLDWGQIGGKDHYLPIAVTDCGVGATVDNTVLAWDRDKQLGAPTWADFWDVTKFPGKRGLHKGVVGNLEIALMADGVAPGDVYKTLSTSDGVDRAFRKLDQLRPFIVWWDTPQDASRILASGDVLMTSAPSAAVIQAGRAAHRNFAIQWADSVYDVLSWAALKGAPQLREAMQFLYFSGTPAIQARLPAIAAMGGLAKGANDGLPPDLAAISPTNPANLQAGLRLDAGFWHANLAKLRPRFDAWLVH